MDIESIIETINGLSDELSKKETFIEIFELYKKLNQISIIAEGLAIDAITKASNTTMTAAECRQFVHEVYGGENNLSLYTIKNIKEKVGECLGQYSSIKK